MRIIKTVWVAVLSATLFSACSSTKMMQSQLRNIKTYLDYELTSPIYKGNPDKTVYLNHIDNSNMEYFTTVKGGNTLVLPFILFNYQRKKFHVVLGENTLTQLYREFLTDALLAECNRSACFNLETGSDTSITDVYLLDVNIIHNQTQSGIQETGTFFILPINGDVIDFQHTHYRVLAPSSNLKIAVSLKKNGQILWKKDYDASESLKDKPLGDNSILAYEVCVNSMTECLSFATKQIVTEISRDLNLILSAIPDKVSIGLPPDIISQKQRFGDQSYNVGLAPPNAVSRAGELSK